MKFRGFRIELGEIEAAPGWDDLSGDVFFEILFFGGGSQLSG